MKQLIRRLSRVADSSQYTLLRSDSVAVAATRRRSDPIRSKIRRSSPAAVPEGHVPVYVGDEMERFAVSAELLNHPVFVKLLNQSAQEYGYEQQGVLRLPCHVIVFERVLDALTRGRDTRHLLELLNSSTSEEDLEKKRSTEMLGLGTFFFGPLFVRLLVLMLNVKKMRRCYFDSVLFSDRGK